MTATEQAAEVMAFVARIAAARKEATTAQLDEMKRKLIPQLVVMRVSGRIDGAKTVLAEIMGHDWRPEGELNLSTQQAETLLKQGMAERGHDPETILGPPR
ncbi:hypothetical protein [Rhodococcoides fascians]|uniref:hypothetical protein n=1 Tax=Rhodococcoides fascians TaxID=1828 RepID=UPI0005643223|nr:hypothetical protein [Rhodococcus fascians]